MKLTVLTEIQASFLNKHSVDYCKPSVNFKSSGKVDFDCFCQYSLCFHGGVDYWRFFLHHLIGQSLWVLVLFGLLFFPLCSSPWMISIALLSGSCFDVNSAVKYTQCIFIFHSHIFQFCNFYLVLFFIVSVSFLHLFIYLFKFSCIETCFVSLRINIIVDLKFLPVLTFCSFQDWTWFSFLLRKICFIFLFLHMLDNFRLYPGYLNVTLWRFWVLLFFFTENFFSLFYQVIFLAGLELQTLSIVAFYCVSSLFSKGPLSLAGLLWFCPTCVA